MIRTSSPSKNTSIRLRNPATLHSVTPPGKLSIYNFQSPSKGRASFAPERTEDSIVARRFAVTFDDYDPLPVLLNATGSSMSLDRIILTGVKYPTIEDLKLKDIPEEVTALFGSVGPQ